jgi:muconolactone delta-isomerase
MRFFVESMLKQAPTAEVLAMIPAEVARGKELDKQGIRQKLYVAADQSRAWQVYMSDSQEDVQMALESLPLHPYVNVVITPLAEESDYN